MPPEVNAIALRARRAATSYTLRCGTPDNPWRLLVLTATIAA